MTGLVPGTLPRRDLRSLRSFERLRVEGGGRGGERRREEAFEGFEGGTKASKPPSKPSKASKPSRARTKGPSKSSKPPSLKPTSLQTKGEKPHENAFWGLKTKKKRKKENETKQTPFTKSQRSLQTKKGGHTRTLLGVKNEENKTKQMLRSFFKGFKAPFEAFEGFKKENEGGFEGFEGEDEGFEAPFEAFEGFKRGLRRLRKSLRPRPQSRRRGD